MSATLIYAPIGRTNRNLEPHPSTLDNSWTAAAGMAEPDRFFALLREQGLTLAHTLALPDHYAFDALPWPADAADVIITEKDAVKLRPDAMPGNAVLTRIWVAPLDFEPEVAFAAALKRHYPYPPKH